MRLYPIVAAAGAIALALLLRQSTPAQEGDTSELYRKRCAGCHGQPAKGDGPAGKARNPRTPDFADSAQVARITDDRLTEVISKGGKGMPAYGHILRPSEVHELVGYIRSLSRTPPR